MKSIKHIRLVSGEELIGYVREIENGINVAYPLVSVEHMTMEGKTMVSLTPYLPFTDVDDNECDISSDKIITYSSVHETVEEHYELSLFFAERSLDNQWQRMLKANEFMAESIRLDSLEGNDDLDLVSVAVH